MSGLAAPTARPVVILVHGFPHTPAVWHDVVAELEGDHDVLAPAMSWLTPGDTTPQDAQVVSAWLERTIQDATGAPLSVVAMDAGVPPVVLLGLRRPDLIHSLVLMESTLGQLPGAEDFFRGGPPWWFGFHAVPGLAERVVAGNEAEYVRWFLEQGTQGQASPDLRADVGEAYARPGVLAQSLELYRALPETGRQLADAVRSTRLTMPTSAVGAATVGRALEQQLRPVTDDLEGHLLADVGHIVPVERPDAVVDIIRSTEARAVAR